MERFWVLENPSSPAVPALWKHGRPFSKLTLEWSLLGTKRRKDQLQRTLCENWTKEKMINNCSFFRVVVSFSQNVDPGRSNSSVLRRRASVTVKSSLSVFAPERQISSFYLLSLLDRGPASASQVARCRLLALLAADVGLWCWKNWGPSIWKLVSSI